LASGYFILVIGDPPFFFHFIIPVKDASLALAPPLAVAEAILDSVCCFGVKKGGIGG